MVRSIVNFSVFPIERTELDFLERRFAILGLTHQFMTAIIKDNDYNALVRAFSDQAAIFSPNFVDTGDVSTSFPASSAQDRSIRPNQEWRFCLFRHWTLWDAMVHSSYIGGKFELWTDRGNSNLTGLLAKIGSVLPLSLTFDELFVADDQILRV